MPVYFLGLDAGGSKTHVLIADETGGAIGFGAGGPGNCSGERLAKVLPEYSATIDAALAQAGLAKEQIAASGFGLAGYDWPSETERIQAALKTLGLPEPNRIANDVIIGLYSGSSEGCGVAVVAGAGENVRGRNRAGKEGRTVGDGPFLGDAGGGLWLVSEAVRAVAMAWTGRNPPTLLSDMLLAHTGMGTVAGMLEEMAALRVPVTPALAPMVFEAAAQGDAVALDILQSAGRELGLNAAAVIRQLDLQAEAFDVVLVGSLFNGQPPVLLESLKRHVLQAAPQARFVRPMGPPVVGAVLLAMEAHGISPSAEIRQRLNESTLELMKGGTGLRPVTVHPREPARKESPLPPSA